MTTAAEKANARRQPGERVNELTDARRLRVSPRDVNATYGPPELCTWPVAPGTCRFQTTRPGFARKLSQRSGARLVAWSEQGGYLRVFEEAIEPWRARDLVRRFLTATNGAFLKPKRPLSRRKSLAVSPQQEVSV